MKNKLKRITSILAVFMLTAILLTGCAPTVDNSGAGYLSVEEAVQWKRVYQIGEELSLDGLTAKYYRDAENLSDFETVAITKNMISGFNTSKEGSFTMTVTYKGKTDTVSYTVVPKATPFEISKTFCIADNVVASVDSASMKVTVQVFDSYFKALAKQPSKTEEKALSFLVDKEGETYASFEYNGSKYDLFYDKANDQYSILSVLYNDESSVGTQKRVVSPISLDALTAPSVDVVYKSETKENTYYSIKIDASYNAVVTKHTVEGDATVDTVIDSYTASDAMLTETGLFRYYQGNGGNYSNATLKKADQFVIRKWTDGSLESIYYAVCILVA